MAVDHYYAIYTDGNGAGASDSDVKSGIGTGIVTSANQTGVTSGVAQSFTATGLAADSSYDLEWVLTSGGTDVRGTAVGFRTKLAKGSVTVISPPPIVRN